MDDIQIRLARAGEAQALSALCRRSKAHWGYDGEFMRLSEAALRVTPAAIASGSVLVAEDGRRGLLGMAAVAPLDAPGDHDLAQLFVEPGAIGSGAGRALFHAAAALARSRGAARLVILSDPFAARFYERMGAVKVGEAPSDAIAGRSLPLLHYALV